MKRITLTIVIYFISIIYLFSQDTKEIITYHPKSKQIHEKYSVLKSNDKIKHGAYISFFRDDYFKSDKLIYEEGQYENDKRTGIWKIYRRPIVKGNSRSWGPMSMTGEYKNGIKSGVWEIYKENGKILEKYDYDNKKRIDCALVELIKFYPILDQIAGTEGDVIISYQLDINCNLLKLSIVKSLSQETDKQCLEILKERFELIKKYSITPNNCDGNEHSETFPYRLQK